MNATSHARSGEPLLRVTNLGKILGEPVSALDGPTLVAYVTGLRRAEA